MDRYEMTLQEYLQKHNHKRLSAEERMHIVVQMLESINASHQAGIAHRDLSTVNFMINSDAKLYLIDFGKAVFYFPRDAEKWWVGSEDSELYKEDLQPASREELAVWCRNLPYVMSRPDHGYRVYRSIQTLPRSQKDREILPYLIDPAAEDIYSLGTMIWKVFSGMEPWPGVFADTELKKLRETVSEDASIDRVLDRSMIGPTSKMFLQMFLRVEAKDRKSAADISSWIKGEDVKKELLKEWSLNNGSRRAAARNNVHCKSNVQKPAQPPFVQIPIQDEAKIQPAKSYEYKTPNYIPTVNPRGRPKKNQSRPSAQSSVNSNKQNNPAVSETEASQERKSRKRKSKILDDSDGTTSKSLSNKNVVEVKSKKRRIPAVVQEVSSIGSKEKVRPIIRIKLPRRPISLLSKETAAELVNRASSCNVHESTRFNTTAPLSTTGLSPQSPLLSPSSNADTVEDTPSPTSPSPRKRKFACDEEEKSDKRRYIEDTEESNVSLFNTLQELRMNRKRR